MNEKLNDLNDKEWVNFTNTIWETDYCHDDTWFLRKKLKTTKSPYVMRDIIKFFTKRGERVLDIFAGTGSTLLGAEMCGREAVGIELYPKWCGLFESIRTKFNICNGDLVKNAEKYKDSNQIISRMINDDCLNRMKALKSNYVDAVICDPPHGAGHTHINDAPERIQKKDFGNLSTQEEFYDRMLTVGQEVHRVLRDDKYWVIMMGDRYKNNEFVPVSSILADKLREVGFQLKGIKVWWNKSGMNSLKPYSVGQSFVPNIVHNNIIIMRKI